MKPGVYPASVTPFDVKGSVDYAALARLMAWFRAGGCTGVVVAGTNGEGPSLSALEKRDLAKSAVELGDGLDVILGVASSSLEEAIWLCKQAYSVGAKGVLLMPPSYFREATSEGIAKWFEAVMDRSPIGIIAYNFPKRTGTTLSAESMKRLSHHEHMIGLKDSSGDTNNIGEYADALAGTGKALFVGDETLLMTALAVGWTGTISGAANLIPGWLSQIVSEWREDQESAETKFSLIEPVLKAIRSCPQPASNKLMLVELGVLPSSEIRLPLELPPIDLVDDALKLVKSILR